MNHGIGSIFIKIRIILQKASAGIFRRLKLIRIFSELSGKDRLQTSHQINQSTNAIINIPKLAKLKNLPWCESFRLRQSHFELCEINVISSIRII